jgi:hypothetical protein
MVERFIFGCIHLVISGNNGGRQRRIYIITDSPSDQEPAAYDPRTAAKLMKKGESSNYVNLHWMQRYLL